MGRLYHGDISDQPSLFFLQLSVHLLPIIRHREHGIRSRERFLQRLLIVNITLAESEKFSSGQQCFIDTRTSTHSTPFFASAWALGLDGSRVIPLILNSLAVRGSFKTDLTTDPPWTPVAPKTTRIFCDDMVVEFSK